MRVEVDPQGLRLTEAMTNESGQPITVTINAKFDGNDYPVSGGPPSMRVSYRLLNDRTMTGIIKEGERVTPTNTVAVGDDGKTLTIVYAKSGANNTLDVEATVWRKK